MGVPAGGLVNHQQVLIFKNDQFGFHHPSHLIIEKCRDNENDVPRLSPRRQWVINFTFPSR
jgi:hypothetical protein